VNVKLWAVAFTVAIALLVLWLVRGPSAAPTHRTVEPLQAATRPHRAQAVPANQSDPRGSIGNTVHEGSTQPSNADPKMPVSPAGISVERGDQSSTGEPDSFSLRDVDFLDSDREFEKVADALRISSSYEKLQKQQKYQALFAKLPQVAAAGVQMQDLLCGQRMCIGTVVGDQPDVDAFFGSVTRLTSVDAPIYATAAVETQKGRLTVRRFAFSTDPDIREVPFKIAQ
jgi:hypothetical protein